MKPHDQFAKNYLEELLSPLGTVETSKEVSDETRQIDVFFSPDSRHNSDYLGLLGRIARETVLLEPYRNPPSRSEIRTCLVKLTIVFSEQQRQAKRENRPFDEDSAPHLWILSPSASSNLLEGFGARVEEDWPMGVYFLPPSHEVRGSPGFLSRGLSDRTAIIAINQLPVTEETRWIRLLGRGKTQEQAVREVLALPEDSPFRENVLELLISWRVSMEIQDSLEAEDREVFMTLSQTYLQWKEATRQEGVQQGIEQGIEQGLGRGKIEGKLESVPRLVALGLTLEQIASALELDLQQVRQAAGE